MSNHITRSTIEHLLKVAIWKDKDEDCAQSPLLWRFLLFAGSNIMSVGESMAALAKSSNNIELYPKIIYMPPQRQRAVWFDSAFILDESSFQLEYEASVTCIGPTPDGNMHGVETYEFSPFELIYMTKDELYEAFYMFCLCRNRIRTLIPKDIMKIIWMYLRTTTNLGYR